MKNRKVCRLLSALDKKQQKRFSLFLSSPYFNTNTDLVTLYTVILKWLKKGKYGTEEAVFKLWKKGEPFNQSTFRRSCSEIVTLFYSFLTHEGVAKNERLKYLCLLEELFLLEGAPEWDNVYQKARKYFADQGQYQKYSGFYQILIEYLYLQHNYTNRDIKVNQTLLSIHKLSKELNYEFCVDVAMLSEGLKRIYPEIESITFPEGVQEEIDRSWESFSPSLKLAYFSFLVTRNHNQADFEVLYSILRSELNNLDFELAQNVLFICLNYSSKKADGRMNEYAYQYYEIAQLGKESGKLFTLNNCKPGIFINNVTIATRLGKEDLWKELRLEWLPAIMQSERQKCELFINGMEAFSKMDFVTSHKCFMKFMDLNDDLVLEIRVRPRLIACLYEMGEKELGNRLDADERFFYRQKVLSEKRIQSGKVFIKAMRFLMNYISDDKKKISQIKTLIRKEPGAHSAWLLQKLDEKSGAKVGALLDYEQQLLSDEATFAH